MKIFVLNSARFSKDESLNPATKAEFRKATRNMIMAALTVRKLLEPFPFLLTEFKEKVGVALGTGHGELETTKDFFKFYRVQGAARPILFQNSLHNSTLGFLSQTFGFTGASATNSDLFLTGERAIETAAMLLREKQALFCLAIGIDAAVPELGETMKRIYPEQVALGEGCGALLLAGEQGMALVHPSSPKALLQNLSYDPAWPGRNPLPDYYDSDAIERFAMELEAPNPSGKLRLPKPDGTTSVIDFIPLKEGSHVPS